MSCIIYTPPTHSIKRKLFIMSTFSLPHLLNGGGLSKNNVVNHKYSSLTRYPASRSQVSTPLPTIISNGTSNVGTGSGTASNSNNKVDILTAKRKTLNRNGSIVRNHFRGIKKQMLESQTNLLLHSMTVSLHMWLADGFSYRAGPLYLS